MFPGYGCAAVTDDPLPLQAYPYRRALRSVLAALVSPS